MTAKPRNTTHFRLDPANPPELTPEQAARLEAMPIDYSDIPELPDDFWTSHPLVERETKEQVTLRLDKGVVEFFRAQGPRYQTRINAVLRTYAAAKSKRDVSHGSGRDRGAESKAAKASKRADERPRGRARPKGGR